MSEVKLKGISNSQGIAIGKLKFFRELELSDISDSHIELSEISNEKNRLKDAISDVQHIIEESYQKTFDEYGKEYADVFLGQLGIIKDPTLIDEIINSIQNDLIKSEFAVNKVLNEKKEFFLNNANAYFRDRALDISDLEKQLIFALKGEKRDYRLDEPSIIVAKEITPTDTINFDRTKILGFITEIGGKTSHSAILARSLNIPSISGILGLSKWHLKDKICVIDAIKNFIIINPTETTQMNYYVELFKFKKYQDNLNKYSKLPSQLKDNTEFTISANIEFPDEIDEFSQYNISSIGLYRSEGFYLKNQLIPDEETQLKEYLKVKEKMKKNPVVIRTLDIGGDKLLKKYDYYEENPFLGWRAIRLCLDEVGLFYRQLRAIIKASDQAQFMIMIPMMVDISELRETKSIIKQIQAEFDSQGIKYQKNIPLGIMVETPVTAIMIAKIIDEIDFVSIGTNDLIQYSLAVDRGNEKVSHLYQGTHPAILDMIEKVILVCNKAEKPVSMCGEMASEILTFPILMGMGLRHLSMNINKSLIIKRIAKDLTLEECTLLWQEIKSMLSYLEINKRLREWFQGKFPDIIL